MAVTVTVSLEENSVKSQRGDLSQLLFISFRQSLGSLGNLNASVSVFSSSTVHFSLTVNLLLQLSLQVFHG